MIGICMGSKQLIDDAKSRGVYTIAVGPKTGGRTVSSLGADEYIEMDTSNIAALEQICRQEKIDAIICGISTFNIGICIELSKCLGLPFYATESNWRYTIDKYIFKELCRETNVPVAKDYFVSDPPTGEELNLIEFPVVVKAVDQSANRGMSYCNELQDIAPACAYARSVSNSTNVIIEKKLGGTEYGVHYLCCMLSQPGYPGNCYSITSTETDRLSVYLQEVHPHIVDFIKKAGIREGVCWFELMADTDGHLYVLEMGYRMSGDLISIPMKQVCGFDEYKWLNDISLGIKHTVDSMPKIPIKIPERIGTSYIIWSNEKSGIISRLDGLEQVEQLKGITIDNILHVGSTFHAYQYLVVVLIESDTIEELIEQIRQINRLVKIEDEHGENIAIYYDDFATLKRMSYEGRLVKTIEE